MVNPRIRSQVWQGLLDSELHLRYFGRLADSYRHRHRIIRFSVLSSVLVEALLIPLSVNFGLPNTTIFWIAAAVGVLIISLVIWEAVSDYASKVAMLDWVSAESADLSTQWHMFWLDVESHNIDDEQARSRQYELLGKFDIIVGRLSISRNEKINLQSEETAFSVIENRYAN